MAEGGQVRVRACLDLPDRPMWPTAKEACEDDRLSPA